MTNKGNPKNFSHSMLMFDKDPLSLGLTRFYKELIDSEIVIGASHTCLESETNPFDIHNCSFVALAISVLADEWFVAGIEEFYNNKSENPPSLGPYTSYFSGTNSRKLVIDKSDEEKLKMIYSFVFNSIRHSTYDDNKAKLLFLYLRSIVRNPSPQFVALKIGIPSILNEKTTIIVNTALFLEHIFTSNDWQERKGEKGVKIWNRHYPSNTQDFENEINIIMKFRHTILHHTTKYAHKHIKEWRDKHGFNEMESFNKIEKIAITLVKNITREIINNYQKYLTYRSDLPD